MMLCYMAQLAVQDKPCTWPTWNSDRPDPETAWSDSSDGLATVSKVPNPIPAGQLMGPCI